MLHRSKINYRDIPQQRQPVSSKGFEGDNVPKSWRILWFRCYLTVAAIVLIALHFHLITIMNRELNGKHNMYRLEIKQNFVGIYQTTDDSQQQLPISDSTQTSPTQYSATFNNIPVQHMDGIRPKVTTVKCVSPKPIVDNKPGSHDKFGWMYRTCEFENLCYDASVRQYVAIKTTGVKDDDDFPSVSIGGINPRWINAAKHIKTTLQLLDDVYNSDIRKVKWKPNTIRRPNDVSSYYQMDDEYIFVPFHSMAGHNVGHLTWDDLYAIYTALRLRNDMDALDRQHHPKYLFLRHVLEELSNSTTATTPQQLYANCDIRRNKRIQCKNNFDRFLPLFGQVDAGTFRTSKTSQLNVSFEGSEKGNAATTSSSLVCFAKTIVGIGMLTDHGWNDHGWDTPQSMDTPHNLGRGRLFFDFTQYLIKNRPVSTTTISSLTPQSTRSTTNDPKSVSQITFSIESSRDWSRRLNFTNHINAVTARIAEDSSSGAIPIVVQSYRMYELSLTEQMDVAQNTNIFVSVCGGGSMTTTFLPRNTVVILFYDPHGGHDYYNNEVHPNGGPARLDWDLLSNAAHLRVHWLPISSMDTPDHIELFLRLVRHELAMIHSVRTTLS